MTHYEGKFISEATDHAGQRIMGWEPLLWLCHMVFSPRKSPSLSPLFPLSPHLHRLWDRCFSPSGKLSKVPAIGHSTLLIMALLEEFGPIWRAIHAAGSFTFLFGPATGAVFALKARYGQSTIERLILSWPTFADNVVLSLLLRPKWSRAKPCMSSRMVT